METYLAYFDETGDDGPTTASSTVFVLTSLYMNSNDWQSNFNAIRKTRQELKADYGFHVAEELHTKFLLSNKDPYRKYMWTSEQKKDIIVRITKCIASLKIQIINVIIDKTKFTNDQYPVLENALKYNIQRIENDCMGEWNYIIITDQGRIAPMRKTARAIRSFNPIQSKYSYDYVNKPIQHLLEDILEKDSEESYFIQMCDFVSYFVNLYYKTAIHKETLPNRVGTLIDESFVKRVLATLKSGEVLNLKANPLNLYGFVIYPK